MDETKAIIRTFLGRHFRAAQLEDDQDFFALNFVNSLFALQLINFVEHEFHITVEDDDLELDNFRSINAIIDLVARKKGSVVPAD